MRRVFRDTDAPSAPVVICYTRVSSEEQSRGDGPARQLAYHEAHAKAVGRTIDYDLRDIGLSAFHGEHVRIGQMGAVQRAAAEGRIPAGSEIWLENLDRFSRQEPIDALGMLIELLSVGIRVRSHMDKREFTRGVGGIEQTISLVMATLSMGRNHDESATKQTRLNDTWAGKIERARKNLTPATTVCPAWIEHVDGVYRVIEERAAIVRRIFEMTATGLGKRAVAVTLNREGVRPWGRGARQATAWQDSYVQKLLSTRMVLGEYQPMIHVGGGKPAKRGAAIAGYYPRVVTDDDWHRARLAASARRGQGGRPSASSSVFTGLLKCRCGSGMQRVNKGVLSGGRTLYTCRHSSLDACDHDTRYDQRLVERLLAVQLRRDVDLLIDAAGSQAAIDRDRLQYLTARIVTLGEERGRLVAAIKRGLDVDEDFKAVAAEIAALAGERERLTSSVAVAKADDTTAAIRAVLDAVRSEDPNVRRRTAQRLRQVIERIDFDGATITLRYVDGPTSTIVSTAGYRHTPKPSTGRFVDGVRRVKDVVDQST